MPSPKPARQLPLFSSEPTRPEDIHKSTLLKHTLPLFEQHLTQAGKSVHTIKAFRADLLLLLESLGDHIAISQYMTSDLDRFLYWLEHERDVPCSRKSYARRVTTLKVYFKWLHQLEAIPHDPAKAVMQRSGPAPLSSVLTPEQVRAAFAFARTMKLRATARRPEAIQDTRPELLFWLLLDTGIKKGETAQLTFDDVNSLNPQRPFLRVRYKVRNVFKERNLDLDSDWLKLLALYQAQYQPDAVIFNCTPRNLEYILTDIGVGAGIPFKLSFEVMRWTSAVRDFRAGVDEDTIREKLGLSEITWHETGSKIRQLAERQAADEA